MIGVITAIGLLIRGLHLNQPLRYDEAVTWLSFVDASIFDAISDYHLPNNHVFHTVLEKVTVGILGSEPWMQRLPAFICGTAIIPLTWLVARRYAAEGTAQIAAALVAGSGALVLYSTNARGYSLMLALFLVLILLTDSCLKIPSRLRLLAIATFAALGFWTIPVMLYPFGGVILWGLLRSMTFTGKERTERLTGLAVATAGAGILSLLLYSPVIVRSGFSALVGNEYVTPASFGLFFRNELPEGLSKSWQLLTLGYPTGIAVAFVLFGVAGLATAFNRHRHTIPILIPVSAWCVLLLLVMHRFPFARIWLFLLPLIAISTAEGISWVYQRMRATGSVAVLSVLALAISLVASVHLATSRAVFESRETGSLVDARDLAAQIRKRYQRGDMILVATFAPLVYWLEREGVPREAVMSDDRASKRYFMVVNEAEGETVEEYLSRARATGVAISVDTLAIYPTAKLLSVRPE